MWNFNYQQKRTWELMFLLLLSSKWFFLIGAIDQCTTEVYQMVYIKTTDNKMMIAYKYFASFQSLFNSKYTLIKDNNKSK